MDNVVILTSGLAGSSVLAGLLESGGYWAGTRTMKKPDYDTKENAQLVALNSQLLETANWKKDYATDFCQSFVEEMLEHSYDVHHRSMTSFLDVCDANCPWVWKDPRLLLTISIWRELLSKRKVKYILLTRDPWQSWISTTKRRQIQSFRQSNEYLQKTVQSYTDYLASIEAPSLSLKYENLLLNPDVEIERLNQFLGTELTARNLERVYSGTLYKTPNSIFDGILAMMIFAKNRLAP